LGITIRYKNEFKKVSNARQEQISDACLGQSQGSKLRESLQRKSQALGLKLRKIDKYVCNCVQLT
jgi:hypothetical protein